MSSRAWDRSPLKVKTKYSKNKLNNRNVKHKLDACVVRYELEADASLNYRECYTSYEGPYLTGRTRRKRKEAEKKRHEKWLKAYRKKEKILSKKRLEKEAKRE